MLVVLDGFGIGDGGPADATALAHAPFFARARHELPMAKIETSGEAVGLPPGQMGNSEVGHMTLGSGRIIDMDMTRISKLLAGGGAAHNPVLQQAFARVAASGGRLHLMGLVSDGGVHSHQAHIEALLAHCRERGVRPVVHAFLDGRDTPPRSAKGFLSRAAPARRGRGRPHRHRDRPLLGDGPRPALGALAARLRRDRAGRRRARGERARGGRRRLPSAPDRRVRRAARDRGRRAARPTATW